jgi:hypothetical protein
MGERVGRLLPYSGLYNDPLLGRVAKVSMRHHGVIRDETWNIEIKRIPRDHVEKLLVRNRALSSIKVFPADNG